MAQPMFTEVRADNSATITLNDNLTGHSEQWSIQPDYRGIANAVLSFAMFQGIRPSQVGFSVKMPEQEENAA